MRLTAETRALAAQDVIDSQLGLYRSAAWLRVEIVWSPEGVINASGVPVPNGELLEGAVDQAPRYEVKGRYKAWSVYSIDDDRSRYLVQRLAAVA